eukprot:TRINITY_DN10586_c0_g1_i2.p1 TRINITY_DN10586_c0_g1~~TRINITY_DN10586_c0_g1_i2.p1  ORF type:complete len:198 (+),score=28.12 TRINITY_DN10586_c0_g1_i2:58-651(+)
MVRANVVMWEKPVSEMTRKEKRRAERTASAMAKIEQIARNMDDNMADPSKPRQRTSATGFWRKRKEAAKARVFVGNLPLDITEAEIRSFFESAGPIEGFSWLRSASTNCMTYVQFSDVETASEACKLNGLSLKGRSLRINLANDASERGKAINKRDGSKVEEQNIEANQDKPISAIYFDPPVKQRQKYPRNRVAIVD